MDTPTPVPVPTITEGQLHSVVDQLVMDATIMAYSKMSEGILLGLDGCRDNGWDLNDRQKVEIMQCLNFTFRDYEVQLREYASMITAMTTVVLTEEEKKMLSEIIEADKSQQE